MNNNEKHYVYVLLTERNTYYCGYTNDIEKRFEKHKLGLGAKYTKAFKPIKIVFKKEFSSKSEALKAEIKFKNLKRNKKEAIINGYLTFDEL